MLVPLLIVPVFHMCLYTLVQLVHVNFFSCCSFFALNFWVQCDFQLEFISDVDLWMLGGLSSYHFVVCAFWSFLLFIFLVCYIKCWLFWLRDFLYLRYLGLVFTGWGLLSFSSTHKHHPSQAPPLLSPPFSPFLFFPQAPLLVGAFLN